MSDAVREYNELMDALKIVQDMQVKHIGMSPAWRKLYHAEKWILNEAEKLVSE